MNNSLFLIIQIKYIIKGENWNYVVTRYLSSCSSLAHISKYAKQVFHNIPQLQCLLEYYLLY